MNRFSLLVWVLAAALPLCGQTSSAAKPTTHAAATSIEPGEIAAGIYHNNSFGFSYRVPYGWVDRTDRMREASTDPARETVLLGVFERPPEANGEGVNSGVVIAAESAASYPGLKSAAQYFGPLTEVTKAQDFEVVEEPYEFVIGLKTV